MRFANTALYIKKIKLTITPLVDPINYLRSVFKKEDSFLDVWIFIGFLFGALFVCSNNTYALIKSYPKIWCLIIIFLLIFLFFLCYTNIFYQSCAKLFIFFALGTLASCLSLSLHLLLKKDTIKIDKDVFSVRGVVDFVTPLSFGGRKDSKIVTLRHVDVVLSGTKKKFDKVQIYANQADVLDIKNGDYIQAFVKNRRSNNQLLPESYDFSLKAKSQNVDFSCFAYSKFKVLQYNKELGNLLDKVYRLRYKIYQSIRSALPNNIADFASALIIGEGGGMLAHTKEDMRKSGLSHILCVSGLHLSLFSIFSYRMFYFLFNCFSPVALHYNIKLYSYIISFLLTFFYWTLSGMNVATTRAFIMSSFATYASILHRQGSSLRTLGVAMVIILVTRPQDVLMPSFQLSFGATFGLITSKYIKFSDAYEGKSKLRMIFYSMLSNIINNAYLGMSVSIITLPIVIYHFYWFSNYQIFANLLAMPIAGMFLMPCVIFSLILSIFHLSGCVLYVMHFGILAVMKIANFFAHLPYSIFYFGHLSVSLVILAMLGIFIFQIFQQRILKIVGLLCFLSAIFLALNQTKPDLIIEADKKIIGIKQDQKLIIYGSQMSKFLKRYWNDWFGQRYVIFNQLDLNRVNFVHTTDNNQHILILSADVDQSDYTRQLFDLIINLIDADVQLKARCVINAKQIKQLGNFSVQLKKNECILKGTLQSFKLRLAN